MFRIDTPNKAVNLFGAGKHGFRDGDKLLGLNATELSAAQQNALQEELAGICEAAGIVLNKANNAQVLEAIQRLIDAQSGNFALDTGAANAYVIALNPAITAYADGMTVRFKIANGNTGASTLNAGAGAAPLVNDAGGELVQGDAPAGNIATATYIGSDGKFYFTSMVPSQSNAGLPSVQPTISGGYITFTLKPCPLTFRNSVQNNGTANTKFITAPQAIVTNTLGASFGASSNVQASLIMLAIDDGTLTPKLGVTMYNPTSALDESVPLTSTTAIAGTPNVIGTVYTATALGAGSYPFKIVGQIAATWTNGAGWVTGIGSVVNGNTNLDYCKKLTIPSGVAGTYYNTTNRWMMGAIAFSGAGAVGTVQVSTNVGGLFLDSTPNGVYSTCVFFVPPGGSYTTVFTTANIYNIMTVA